MWLPQSDATELLDREIHHPPELAANLRDIARINRYFGGTRLVLQYLRPFLPQRGGRLDVLDIATGAGDIPLAIVSMAKRSGIDVRIVGVDRSPDVLAVAQRYIGKQQEIELVEADAFKLPYQPGSFDIVLCSLAYHHFGWHNSVQMLRQMALLSRHAYIVNDLVRSRLGYISAWLLTRFVTTNRYTRHDAPLSVARAFTPAEYRAMLRVARLPQVKLYFHPFFRAVIVGTPALSQARSHHTEC